MINRKALAPYVMPIVYFVVGVIVVIGIAFIAIRAVGYEFISHVKDKLK
jgi:hypothetical protein